MRAMVVEATALRFGVFLYVLIGSLIILLLLVVGHQSQAESVRGLVQ